jgi:hypothetical protein
VKEAQAKVADEQNNKYTVVLTPIPVAAADTDKVKYKESSDNKKKKRRTRESSSNPEAKREKKKIPRNTDLNHLNIQRGKYLQKIQRKERSGKNREIFFLCS